MSTTICAWRHAASGRSRWRCPRSYACACWIGRRTGCRRYPGHAWALDLLFYVIGWIGYAVLSRSLVAALGRSQHWPRFITVWNWCNVVQYLLLVIAGLPLLFGAPDWVDETAGLVALGWALWLEWFAARVALDVSGVAAVGMVVLDITIGLLLSGVTEALLPT